MYINRKQIDDQLKPGRDDSDWKEREGSLLGWWKYCHTKQMTIEVVHFIR